MEDGSPFDDTQIGLATPSIAYKLYACYVILVVGGAGFVGSHVVRELQKEGREHLVLDNLERGFAAAVSGSTLVHADLRDPNSLLRVFSEHAIDSVIHLAAYIEVGESNVAPERFWENNVIGSFHLLEAMRHSGVKKIVFSSTAAVYGNTDLIPIHEDQPLAPTNPYGATKVAVERMIRSYHAPHGLESICLRYFNAAGSDPDGVLGEAHQPETHLIPIAIDAALGRRTEMCIFGNDFNTDDGTCIRDYVHVTDLARAHLLALDNLRSARDPLAINLGSGSGQSVAEVVESVRRVSGIPFEVKMTGRRAGDPARLVASNRLAREVLGWEPTFTELDEIVSHAFCWRKAHPNGYGV